MICPNCEQDNPDETGFCLNCGVRIGHYCSYCGNFLPLTANFCNRCGQAQRPYRAGGHDTGRSSEGARRESAAGALKPTDAQSEPPAEIDHPLHQYIPKELLGKLEHARASGGMAGERRIITMLFCDVKGSTAVSEQLDPEEWTEIINGAFEHMIKPVYNYEGTVARLMGDGVLAFFGAPIAHEDDPQRAVLAGLDIVEGMKAYSLAAQKRWGITINVRVGLNTGMVVVGTVGSDLRLEYTAMGDAINLAARMEQTAQPGTVQIAHDTYKVVNSAFDVEDLGAIHVKGKAEAVPAYRVLGRKDQIARLLGKSGSQVDLVGRNNKLVTLEEVLIGVRQGVGQIVCLVGEAGVGKSRLIAEARALAAGVLPDGPAAGGSEIAWHETGSLSFETSNPYGLFQRLIRRECGITASDPAPVVREKLSILLDSIDVDRRERAEQVLEALFAIPGKDGTPPLSGESFRQFLFGAMVDLWSGRYKNRPTVLVFDDLHWSDPGSIELILHLFPLIEKLPLALFCAFRPDRLAPAWQLKLTADADYPHLYREIPLKPLPEEQCDLLVNKLLPHADLPEGFHRRIWERSLGNPFFIEEVIRSLKDNNTLVQEEREIEGENSIVWYATRDVTTFEIPDNLQSLLAARIDRLADDVRQILELAAVIGPSFRHRLLAAVAAEGSTHQRDVQAPLKVLLRIEMIQIVTRVPEVEYKFNNPLTREVAYNIILLKKRRKIHHQVAQVIEAQFPDRLADFVLELGHHFGQAQKYSRAFNYYVLAGDNAARLFANTDAATYYGRASDYADQIDLPSPDLARLYTRLGRVYELKLSFAEALATYQRLAKLGQDRQDKKLKLASLVACATLYATRTPYFDPHQSEVVSLEALALAQKLKNKAAESKILWILMMRENDLVDGDTHKAVDLGRRSLEIAREQDLREQMAYTLNNLTPAYWHIGQPALAQETGREANALWLELGNLPMQADANNLLTLGYSITGDFDSALATGQTGYEIGRSLNNPWTRASALVNLGLVNLNLGLYGTAMDCLSEFKQAGKQAGSTFLTAMSGSTISPLYRAVGAPQMAVQECLKILTDIPDIPESIRQLIYFQMARSYAQQGELVPAVEALEQGRTEAQSASFFRVYLPREDILAECEIALAGREYGRALALSEKQIAEVNKYRAKAYLAEALYLKSKALLGLDQSEEALRRLAEARSVAEELNIRRILWPILAMMSQIEMNRGAPAVAQKLAEEATEIIAFIADGIEIEEQRRSFLEQADIQAAIIN